MQIRTQSEWQRCKKPDFCYLCGSSLGNGEETDDDHCPPKKIFSSRDLSNYPIILKTHKACNGEWSKLDVRFASLWSNITGNASGRRVANKVIKSSLVGGHLWTRLIHNVPLEKLQYRILRCMHAILYNEFLKDGTGVEFYSPYIRLNPKTLTPTNVNIGLYYALSRQLIASQKVEVFDGISSHNGKFKYVCTWDNLENGQDICIFALDVNDMYALAPKVSWGLEVSVGYYIWPRPLLGPKVPRTKLEYPTRELKRPIFI
jgi:hypothetical protein